MEITKKEEKMFLEKEKTALESSKISIVLNTYDDIFSDFDPRPYTERALSDDFLIEAKKAVKSKASGDVELAFMVPSRIKYEKNESLIKKRLRDHFKKHHTILHDEIKSLKKKGIELAIFGAILGILATVFAVSISGPILRNSLLILLEPACWFMMWTGFEFIFLISREKKPELTFYEKMTRAEISFNEY